MSGLRVGGIGMTNYSCVQCLTLLRPRKNDVCVHITTSDGLPYQLWQADLWECPDCGNQVLLGFGRCAWSEHYENDFAKHVKSADYTINGKLKALP